MNTTTRLMTVLLAVGLALPYVTPSRGADSESADNPPAAPAVRPTPVPATPVVVPAPASTSVAEADSVRHAMMDMAKNAAKRAAVARSGNWRLWMGEGSGGSLLIVPAGQPQEGQVSQTREDLGVMAKILADHLRQADLNPDEGMVFFGGQRPVRALYLAGFGAVFVVQVNFPLLPSAEAKQIPAEETTDEVWAKTRQQILAPGSSDEGDKKRPEFDAAKVSNLKDVLTSAIKHATNIKAVAGGESVALVVMGAGQEGQAVSFNGSPDLFGSLGSPAAGEGSVLIIKAGKKDIDAYAKGQLDQDGFRKKAMIITY